MTRDGERREKKQKTAAAAAEAAAKERWDLSRSRSQLPLNGRVSQLRCHDVASHKSAKKIRIGRGFK